MAETETLRGSALADTDLVRSPSLSGSGIQHAFFTRRGGVSDGIYAGLNCGIGSQDAADAVRENRKRAATTLGTDVDRLATPWQVHSADAVIVERNFAGERPKADGIVTATPGLAVGVVTADCGPVLFADNKNGVVAAAHAGWRGALGGILDATLAAMEQLGAERSSIVAVLGPTITQPNYEVGLEMMKEITQGAAARAQFFTAGRTDDKRQFDLPGFIVSRLSESGVRASFVERCTYAEPDTFFSFRRTTHRGEPDYGRQLSAIVLRG